MVSVVIPALNEQEAIVDTVKEVIDVLKDRRDTNFEVIVVDDGSNDDTVRLAEEAGARVVRHPHNVGYGRAIKNGTMAARHDTIVITDADGTYPITVIPKLLDVYSQGFDMVIGARTGQHYQGSAIKWPLRLVMRWLVEWTTNQRIPDINSGLRVYSRSTMQHYRNRLCDTFSFTTSLTLAYTMTGKFVTYVPIPYGDRIGKTKVRLWKDSLRTLQYIVQAILYYNPLKIFLLLSAICVLGSAISVAIGIVFQIATGFIMGVGTLLAGIVVFCLGLLADLLKQIMAK